MPDSKKKAFRLDVDCESTTVVFQYDTEKEANLAAEQIIKQGFVIEDWSEDETTTYHRSYVPLNRIRSLDVIAKE